jgi:hypothetical protein
MEQRLERHKSCERKEGQSNLPKWGRWVDPGAGIGTEAAEGGAEETKDKNH